MADHYVVYLTEVYPGNDIRLEVSGVFKGYYLWNGIKGIHEHYNLGDLFNVFKDMDLARKFVKTTFVVKTTERRILSRGR